MDVSEHVVNHLPKITKRLMVGWLMLIRQFHGLSKNMFPLKTCLPSGNST
jgi:hypothetical protein